MKKIFSLIIPALSLLIISIHASAQNDNMFYRAAGSPANPKVEASWNKYYTYQGVVDLCTRLARTFPDLVTMQSIGKENTES
jgi:hypothetical protein